MTSITSINGIIPAAEVVHELLAEMKNVGCLDVDYLSEHAMAINFEQDGTGRYRYVLKVLMTPEIDAALLNHAEESTGGELDR
jgi:hypothetical protein